MEAPQTITIPITFELAYDSASGQPGTFTFAMADCIAKVKNGNGKEMGKVSGRFGASYELQLEDGKRSIIYRAYPSEFWNKFIEAMGKPELKFT